MPKKSILAPISGRVGNIIIQKNGVIRIVRTNKNKRKKKQK